MRILVATDGSRHSEEAVRVVASRPWPEGTVVRLLSAVPNTLPPPPAPAWETMSMGYEAYRDTQIAAARDLAEQAADTIRKQGLVVETAVRSGDARDAIVDEAEEWSADLVVVGSRGLTGVKRWLLGSVAQYVVGHAPCSVEVVRHKTIQ